MASQAAAGRGLQDAVSALQEVIKSQQTKGQEHEPTPTEYFAVISTMVSVGSGGDRLMDLLKVLSAVVPSAAKAVVQSQFKSLSQSLLNILKANANDEGAVHIVLQALGAVMQQQEQTDGFWSAVHALQCVNALLSFVDSDSTKIRKLSTEILSTLMRTQQQKKAVGLRSYIADFCVGVILSCSRAAYKRTHCIILFLESVLALVPEEKVIALLEYSLRLQLCEVPKLTAAVYRMYDTTFQSPYYTFTTPVTLQATQLLLASRPATSDMESNTYYCTALASAVLCLRKQDKTALLTGTPTAGAQATASASATSGLLNKTVARLVSLCESDFVQVHCAVSTALKRILCTAFERRTNATIAAAVQSGTAALEEAQLQALLQSVAGLFQLKFQNAWLYLLDSVRSLFDLFRHNGRPAKMLAKVVTSLVEVYQAIEHGVLQNVPATVHIALTETVGTAVRALGLKAFLEVVPLVDSTGQIPSSREWLFDVLRSNLKHMPCYLADFGNCLLPVANSYFKLLKNSTAGAVSAADAKVYRTRISQLWSLLPEMCTYNVRDLADTYSKLAPIMERLFSDADFPELLTHVVNALHQLAKGVRERCPRPTAGAKEVATPELTAVRGSTPKFVPLVLQYVEGANIGESKFQEGVQCIAALCEVAPPGLVSAVSKKLLQLVLTSTAANGLSDPRENAAAAGWMAVMVAIIPLLSESLVQLLFKSIRPLLTASEASSVQKRAYSLLLALLNEHRAVVLALEQPLPMLRAVSEALLTCHVSSRAMRLQCIRSLMTEMSDEQLEQALRTVLKEVLICQKDANKKTRDGAVDILKFWIVRLPANTLLQLLTTALAGVANVNTNAGSVLKSSIVTALCLLLLHHRRDAAVLSAGVELLPPVGELLVDDCPHQTKAVLSYIRVFVSTQPVAVVADAGILPGVVAAFTVSLGSHKAKFAPRCRAIMRKLHHRIGEELLRSVVPPSDQPLLDYVCKHERRAKRRRDLKEQQSREDRMLGSDSDTDGSDDEDDEMDAAMDADQDGADGALSGTAREITRTLAGTNLASDEDYRLGKRPKAMRVGDVVRTALPTTLDDLLEDQPSARQGARGDASKGAGNKRGRNDFDAGSGSTAARKKKSGANDDDEDRFNVVVGADGRVVVKEVEVAEDAEENAAPEKRGKPSTAQEAESEGKAQASKQEGPQKKRRLTLKEPGMEYRAKNAGGDVWKKGMLAPHAFIPLDPRLLSKKHREQAVDHFGVIVKGKGRRAGGSKGKASSDGTGSNFIRNKPKQKRHK